MSGATTAILIASTAVSAVGAIAAGNAQAASAKSAANAAQYNATIAEQNAQTALQASSANEDAQRRKSAVEMGRLRASLAENGVGFDSGSGMDLVTQSDMNAELDALNIRYGGQQQARAYRSQSALDTASAEQARLNASAASTGGYLSAGASALTGYGKYYSYSTGLTKTPF
ncbi:hypothetical protein UFOVP16_43 [uncultured Caudovirales phage]|uniref:Uncharacterized protein n=1 Tax=uncultured Caudovirales phage TaxID=2100421 RepID=A0A6J5KLM3_9CAUD|nr:hypothetical protein UFOVP16_43 [uncultured Caudovirales phage]